MMQRLKLIMILCLVIACNNRQNTNKQTETTKKNSIVVVIDSVEKKTPIFLTSERVNENKTSIHLSDTTEVRAFIKKVQKSIAENDTLSILNYFKYPLCVGYVYDETGGRSIWVYSPEEFIAHENFIWIKCLQNVILCMVAYPIGENDSDEEHFFYIDESEDGTQGGNMPESINGYVLAIEIVDTCSQSLPHHKKKRFSIERVEEKLKITDF